MTAPHSLEAEQELLGSILANNRALDVCMERLKSEHFYSDVHAAIYSTMLRLRENSDTLSVSLLAGMLSHIPNIRDHLAAMVANATSPSSVRDYMRVVIEMAGRRQMVTLAETLTKLASNYEADANVLLGLIQDKVDEIGEELQNEEKPQHISEVMPQTLDEIENAIKGNTKYIHTGIAALDQVFNGFAGGQVTIIGGGTGIGKSSILVSLALQCAKQGKKVLAFSLEMSGSDITKRVLASETDIGYSAMDRGDLNKHDFERIFDAARMVRELPVIMATKGEINIDKIKAQFRRYNKAHDPVGIVIVDYLQLVKSVSEYRGNKNLQVAEVSRQLKLLAMNYDVPIVVMSQFSRDYARDGREPALHDLRDSGSIEQDADNVLLLHRPDGGHFNDLKIIVAKQRRGHRGDCIVQFNKATSKFTS